MAGLMSSLQAPMTADGFDRFGRPIARCVACLEFSNPPVAAHISTGTVMTNSSFLGGERAARHPAGKDVDALGPSDSSDSGSDVQGERSLCGDGDQADELGALIVDTASDSDAAGTGERASATGRDAPDGADILPDHLIGPEGEAVGSAQASSINADVGELTAKEIDQQDATDENA
jgi:hypothetical protein